MRSSGLQRKPPRRTRSRAQRSGIAPYPNIAKVTTHQRVNELWLADFTEIYIRSRKLFVSVVLDAFSRRCIAWFASWKHNVELTLGALQKALAARRPPAGFIHHSDQGSEYMAYEYVELVAAHSGIISASRKGTPTDNPVMERFMNTLKHEELLDHDFANLEEFGSVMTAFVVLYNEERLHSSLDYRTPAEFERNYYAALKSKP